MRIAVVTDVHYHSLHEGDHTLASKVKPPFGNGMRYAKELTTELKKLREKFERKEIDKIIFLGDIFDFLSSEAMKNYYAKMKGKEIEKEIRIDNKKFKEGYDAFENLIKEVKDLYKSGALVFIAGNHDYTNFIKDIEIKPVKEYTVRKGKYKIIFAHGDRFDFLMNLLGFNDYALSGVLKRKKAPVKGLSKGLANLVRLYGYVLEKARDFFEKYDLRKKELVRRSRRLNRNEIYIIGHTHRDIYAGKIISLGDYLQYGVHYLEIGEREISIKNKINHFRVVFK